MLEISSKDFVRKLQSESLNVIDVREDFEVQMGMIEGALHIPMNTIPDHMHELKIDETYYIVCAHGVRSERVTEYLMEHDFKAVNVQGGMAEIEQYL
ncbi:rhodanese-like domain-containing protein [Macrococcus armenti]|uniref:rhodanese-like domain-containing protein n=1 Tax=Macrococcus armenti TaxID=2875764 RepID=UPI001CCB20E3|nr:rhodanese-like domain-containing protein [Macrococcus armenti]UBH21726.1 rhodanese-like domain-containing protein [Macrococcus armenti]